MTYTVSPVGYVRDGRSDPANTDNWGGVVSSIAVDARFGEECLSGLEGFSHVEVLFVFHLATEREDYTGTPVIDIKPVMREFLPTDVDQPAWAGLLMGDYFKQ